MDESKGRDSRTAALPTWLTADGDRSVLALHVQPGARRTQVVGAHGDRLKIAVTERASEGRANQCLVEFLAEQLGVARRSITVVSGQSAREKRVAITSALSAEQIVSALVPITTRSSGRSRLRHPF